MALARDLYPDSPESALVSLARNGDRDAFAELVRRRQIWIRNLMRRLCTDVTLADDLSQQVFLQAWRKIRYLQKSDRFGAWLKRVAITTWLQHVRKKDPMKGATEFDQEQAVPVDNIGVGADLDSALAMLSDQARLCIVLSYHEGMTHEEIAESTKIPLGTVKSHIHRGVRRLRELLSDYEDVQSRENCR